MVKSKRNHFGKRSSRKGHCSVWKKRFGSLTISFHILTVYVYIFMTSTTLSEATSTSSNATINCGFKDTCVLRFNSSEKLVRNYQNWTEKTFKSYCESGHNYVAEDGLVRMLSDLGLIDGSTDNHEQHEHEESHDEHDEHEELHDDHEESHSKHEKSLDEHDEHEDSHDEDYFKDKTIVLKSVTDILDFYYHGVPHENVKIYYEEFSLILPRVLYDLQLYQSVEEREDHDHSDHEESQESRARVWGVALVSVLVISLLSVIGIMIVPLMGKSHHFKRLLSFLVALAVGTLVGDALLHLLPHAMSGGEEGHDHSGEGVVEERSKIVKSLVAVFGIYIFFVFESCMGMVRKRRQKRKSNSMDLHQVVSPSSHKSQEYLIANKTELNGSAVPLIPTPDNCSSNKSDDIIIKSTDSGISSTNNMSSKSIHDSSASLVKTGGGSKTPPFPIKLNLGEDEEEEENIGDDINGTHVTEHDHSLHGGHSHHSHHHHHHIMSAEGIKDLAWMIIAGDGLHNFSDGLAIGAAFSSNIAAGLSTSLAIFCHELPHELGDFAVLIDAGMSIKKALLYNGLCACLAFIGAIIGLLIGEFTVTIKLWILAITAGGFLYVALVDMLPQMLLQCVQKGGFVRFIYQNIGLLMGVNIMLLIAWFEESFSRVFKI